MGLEQLSCLAKILLFLHQQQTLMKRDQKGCLDAAASIAQLSSFLHPAAPIYRDRAGILIIFYSLW